MQLSEYGAGQSDIKRKGGQFDQKALNEGSNPGVSYDGAKHKAEFKTCVWHCQSESEKDARHY